MKRWGTSHAKQDFLIISVICGRCTVRGSLAALPMAEPRREWVANNIKYRGLPYLSQEGRRKERERESVVAHRQRCNTAGKTRARETKPSAARRNETRNTAERRTRTAHIRSRADSTV